MNEATELKKIRVNGIDLAYFERGKGPLVICLHGFPDTAYGMLDLLDSLVDAGFRVVAPFLRGYYPSSQPKNGDYTLPTLAADIIALADALAPKTPVAIVGHDWGGLIAYHAANLAPEKFCAISAMAIPHMHSAKMSWQQFKNIWYTLFFQLAVLPEFVVARNDYAFIEKLYKLWSPSWQSADDHIAAFKAMAKHDGALAASLAYYRCMVRKPSALAKRLSTQVTDVPALWIMGREDGCVDLGQVAHLDESFSCGVKLVVVDAGHFPHAEKPEQVLPEIVAFLRRHSPLPQDTLARVLADA